MSDQNYVHKTFEKILPDGTVIKASISTSVPLAELPEEDKEFIRKWVPVNIVDEVQ